MLLPLIIVGVSARAGAQAARRAGFAPYSIDLFADLDTQTAGSASKVISYPHGFLPALQKAPPAAWMYTGGLENYPQLVEQLSHERPLLGNSADTLCAVRNPDELSRVLRDAGCLYPTVESGISQHPRVVKPLRSGGGRGVRLLPAGDPQPIPSGWYQQRFIEGLPVSALFVADGKAAQRIGSSRQLLRKDVGLTEPYGYAGSIAPLRCMDSVNAQFDRIGSLIAREFNLCGVFGVDFILRDEQLWVLEVNPRLTASAEVIERATSRNPVAMHAAAFGVRSSVPSSTSSPAESLTFYGKAIIYARVSSIAGDRFAGLVCEWNSGQEPGIADLPKTGTFFNPGEPVATVFAGGVSEAEVFRSLQEKSEYALCRLDEAI